MTDDEVLREVADALEAAAARYRMVSSKASSMWGVPRASHDCDVVVALEVRSVDELRARLAATFYFPRTSRSRRCSGGPCSSGARDQRLVMR